MRQPQISDLFACLCLTLGSCSQTDLVGAQFVSSPPTAVVAEEPYAYPSIVAGAVPELRVYTLLSAPAGMTVDALGLVSWTPSFAQFGVHPVSLRVSDGEEQAVQNWEIVVHQDLLFGVSDSPRGHSTTTTDQDRINFAAEHGNFGRLVGHVGPWRDSLSSAGAIPSFATEAMQRAAEFNFEVVLGFQWAAPDGTPDLISDGDGIDNSWTNQETRDEFLMMVEGFALIYHPTYLFLGHEVNSWALVDPAGWVDWLSELEQATAAIHAVSPLTQVFTVFQLEHLKGLGAATQGWTDAPQWNLVDDLEAGAFLDGVGFTSYPYFEYTTPQAIPAAYYSEAGLHWSGPQFFTEIGWPATASAPFPGDEVAQSDLVGEFLVRTEGLPLELALWLYLHDFDGQAATPAFTDMGLRNNDGMLVRHAEAAWSSAVSLRQRP